ncbi:ABC transporter permease [Dethiosulfovibrio salsuginis]|uniref:Oligopeptide transport system permease protein n=1 Tax=Dethiosulfovibrio salsuginis TaxID=561720 RepID=A0A1X7JWD1_9BACT|nr:ABC transporter permease [Dethiosulfovibrio salsuginis]SMG32146.1 oligopeptide transport system permease protein [Dethiosulfovibrio salsuginis]
MAQYILKRISYMILTLLVVIAMTFFLMRSIPGDPLASLARALPEQTKANFYAKYGLDKPLFQQYLIYMKNLLKGDLGESVVYAGRSVSETIVQTSPVSAAVGGLALIVGLIVGISLGIVAALYKNSWPDYLVMFIAILGITIPVFVLASLFQYFFSVKLGWLPTSGWGKPQHMVLPVIVLCFGTIATYARYIKSSMLEVLGQDYILTARAKGLSEFQVITRHVMRNSMLPAITILAGRIVGIFTGAFVVERMFSIPGIGFYYISSINNNDYSMTLGTTVFYAALFVVMQLIVDFVYMLVDPRIRLAGD